MRAGRLPPGLGLLTLLGCAAAQPASAPPPAPVTPAVAAPAVPATPAPSPLVPPREAMLRGWMPLAATGVPDFLRAHPSYDGRGVLIAILDSGIDPAVEGLGATTTGQAKLLDLRDFSGEGAVPLQPIVPQGDRLTIGTRRLGGAGRVLALAVGGRVYGGAIAEIPLGQLPASDLNGDRDDTDTLAVVVARATDGWVLMIDADGDGSLENDRPVRDYLVARETFAWRTGTRAPTITLAANLRDAAGEPRLDLYFDTSGHGTHVAGIAAANDMYGVAGFDGVAPGAHLLGLKIANNAQGGISTTGSMIRALDYAIRFAAARRLPLVVNLSFGVGNEAEGHARIDRLIDSVLARHPEVVFTVSAGNDGPGLSTMGFPGSTQLGITVGASFPAVFLGATGKGGDPVAYFSSRGGESAKPDLVAPGLAYSTVPRWNTGDERKGGTSMASPHAAGLVALLLSGLAQEGRAVRPEEIRQALMVTARPIPAATVLDDGTGQPDVGLAWRWLAQRRQLPEVAVHITGQRGNAHFRQRNLGAPADTTFHYRLTLPAGSAPLPLRYRSSADWLLAPAAGRLLPGENPVELRVRPGATSEPGVYTGVVTGWSSDTAVGPVVRLVATVVVADTGLTIAADLGHLAAGATGRAFFEAMAARPFAASIRTAGASEQVLAYLHEPGGQPFREENGIGAGAGEAAGEYVVDARDVVPGFYEVDAVAPPLDGATAQVLVRQSPVTIRAARAGEGIGITLGNLTPDTVTTEPFVVLVGAERTLHLASAGAPVERVRFRIPAWAVHATVDVSLDRAEWPRFTDLGVTLLDAAGRQLGKSPLNYAFGRLHVDLDGVPEGDAEVALFPGFADPDGDHRWTATLSIRLYVDSAHVSQARGQPVAVPPGAVATLTVPMPALGIALGTGFVPLGIVVVPEDERTWTLEVPLPSAEVSFTP